MNPQPAPGKIENRRVWLRPSPKLVLLGAVLGLPFVIGAVLAFVFSFSADDSAPSALRDSGSEAATPNNAQPAPQPTTTAVVPDLPAPTTEFLQDSLARFVDPAIPADQKVGLVVDGLQFVPLIDSMNTALADYGRITFAVNAVEVQGNQAIAAVEVTTPLTPPIPLRNVTWENSDGTWRLTPSTTCNLLAFGRTSCQNMLPGAVPAPR
ncbi:hypothetical protein [Antrihabitans sp. YC2-6]|uniref:hypothetical protein n=1 Tax=Antrihabitans sp. YC2-6 TaxID=2799498 RepID=UPI0018F5FD53|nr:hypothetical protein [Antrihabitans sp. YC2-6]MBJ8345605.1 hypothetical protein [Antrihabitans sp. YC2-6]